MELEILNQKPSYQGFYRVNQYQLRFQLFNGKWSEIIQREVVLRKNAVGVLLYDAIRDEIVLIEQFRLAAHLANFPAWVIEIVAGLVDHKGEETADVARREAKEEANLEIGDLIPIHDYMPSTGGSNERVMLFCGKVDSNKAGGIFGLESENENIKVLVLKYSEMIKLLEEGKIINGLTLISLYWLMIHRDELRKKWL